MQDTPLSEATTNLAKQHGLGLSKWFRHQDKAWFIEITDLDREPQVVYIAAYRVSKEGGYTFDCSCLDGDHDFPAWIRDEQHLRDLLPEFAAI